MGRSAEPDEVVEALTAELRRWLDLTKFAGPWSLSPPFEPAVAEPWNHDIHYHRLVVAAVPPGAQRALDVGCGEGTLARQLRALVPHVTGIDVDAASIALARQAGPEIEYLLGDFLTYPFHPASFDFIASVATLHRRRARTHARPAPPRRHARHHRPPAPRSPRRPPLAARERRRIADPPPHPPLPGAPVPHRLAPARDVRAMRRIAARILPGARLRRHVLWRYSLVWTKA